MATHSQSKPPVSAQQSSDGIDGGSWSNKSSSKSSSSSSYSSSGELAAVAGGIAQRTRRLDSYGDPLPVSDPQLGNEDDDDGVYLLMRDLAASPRYVSFEDVLDTEAFKDGSGRRPAEAGISHPLLRKASRLYALDAGPRPQHRRQRSPGPLGTRRGSTMHGVVKKYVHPFLGFLADVFCCSFPS